MSAMRKSFALGPSARNLISHYRLDTSQIVSTGPHHTILKSDVLNFINLQAVSQKASAAAATTTNYSTKKSYHPLQQAFANKYSRQLPCQFEIDVINSGGVI